MKRKPKHRSESAEVLSVPGYDAILREVAGLLETARRTSARAVNAVLTATYWQIGRRIAEFEMGGGSRATYGDTLVRRLAADLTAQFGRGFGRSNLYQMRSFFLAYREIVQTPSGQLPAAEPGTILQTCLQDRNPEWAKKARRFAAGIMPRSFPRPCSIRWRFSRRLRLRAGADDLDSRTVVGIRWYMARAKLPDGCLALWEDLACGTIAASQQEMPCHGNSRPR